MDRNVPAGAALLLDFIASYEAPKGYGTVYGNKQSRLPKPLTSMTLAEVIAAGPGWSKSFGSSACGRYQFMTATLKDLRTSLVLMGDNVFSADLQDRLGYALLQRRGYASFMSGLTSATAFGLAIAKEWASFPVLVATRGQKREVARGQSFYSGDGLNKALVKPEAVEAALVRAKAASSPLSASSSPPKPAADPLAPMTTPKPAPSGGLLRSGAQAAGTGTRGALNALYDLIHTTLARKV